MTDTPPPDLLHKMHACWRAAAFLSVGQTYLQDNPLFDEPPRPKIARPAWPLADSSRP